MELTNNSYVIYLDDRIYSKKIRDKKVGKDTKTFKEKYIEEIKLAVQLEKMKKRESIFYSAYMNLKSKIKEISNISKEYILKEKEENITNLELQNKIDQTKANLEEDYRNLDLFITKYTIKDKLSYVTALDRPLLKTLLILMGGMLSIILPFELVSNQNFYGLYLISFIFGSFATKIYVSNKTKSANELYNILNNELLENDNLNESFRDLNNKIGELFEKIVEQEIKLAKYQIKLNNLTTQTTNLRKTRILPRKEIISNNLPKRKILRIKKLENKRYN